jgi:preprotein translocase subunit SecD
MTKNLGWKLVLIVGTLIVFVYGIFGIPSGLSGSALSDAIQKRINLGLDLREELTLFCRSR